MNSRVAILSIIVESEASVEQINNLLHEFRNYIIGRFGIPYREKSINIIGVVLDAEQDKISTLSGKIGRLEGVSCKATYQAER